jgi:hypothetical protein
MLVQWFDVQEEEKPAEKKADEIVGSNSSSAIQSKA